MILEKLIKLAIFPLPFSDILIESDKPIYLKMPFGWESVESLIKRAESNGKGQKIREALPFTSITKQDIELLMGAMEPDLDWKNVLKERAISKPLEFENWRLRINVFYANSRESVKIEIRRIPRTPPSITETGLPDPVRILAKEQTKGLILVSGATGSGKSTTMASIIAEIASQRNNHIITIEDPIEYKFDEENSKSIFSQREVGLDVKTFHEGLFEAMRQAPDVILIGEIRDTATAETALLAAESGHLVLASIHASTSSGTIQKMLNFFPQQDKEGRLATLSTTLVAIINQTLLPSIDGSGRVLAAEILANQDHQCSKFLDSSDQIANHFSNAKDQMSVSMETSLFNLIKEGKIGKIDAIRAVRGSPALFAKIRDMSK